MSANLSETGGASCQMCTATNSDLKDRDLVTLGDPINRFMTDAIEIFSNMENVMWNFSHSPLMLALI